MLVQNPMGVESHFKDAEAWAMYQKAQMSGFMDYDMPTFGMKQQQPQHKPRSHQKQSKRSRPPVEQSPHWVALVFEPSGKISKRSSSSMKLYRDEMLKEALPKFSDCLQAIHGNHMEARTGWASEDWTIIPEDQVTEPEPQHRPHKRKKGIEDFDISDATSSKENIYQFSEEDPDPDRSGSVHYRADATEDWEKWFNDAFRAVQQVSCRIIAKEWIKTIHPKKQSTHPYNGKNPRTGERGDPSSTKPPYWPRDVIHKEPDHINKEARTKLLVHLLMRTPHQEMATTGEAKTERSITAMALKESLEQKKQESQNKDLRKKWSIVEHIIDVRTHLEQYEDEGISGDTLISAPDFSDYSRGSKVDEDSEEAEDALESNDQEEMLEEARDISAECLQEEMCTDVDQVSNVSQQPQFAEREPGVKQGNRRSSRREEARSAPACMPRKSQHIQVPQTQPSGSTFHPPLIMPGWDNFQNSLIGLDHRSAPPPSQHNNYPQEGFGAVHWNHQVHPSMDITSQFAERCMIAPGHMGNTNMHGGYIHQTHSPAFVHQPNLTHPPGYPMEGQNSAPMQVRGSMAYDAFMTERPTNGEMMQRGYFPM